MDIDTILDKLTAAGVSVWLDPDGKLRIDKDAPAELKQLVREHKEELIDVRKAQDILNANGMRTARIRSMTQAELLPDVAEAIAAYRQVFDVKSLRVVGPDEQRGIPYRRWLMDQITRQSEKYLRNTPPLVMQPIPVPKNIKPPLAG